MSQDDRPASSTVADDAPEASALADSENPTVTVTAGQVLNNQQQILGVDEPPVSSGTAAAGGVAVEILARGTLNNSGLVSGGSGGNSLGLADPQTNVGGSGGVGVIVQNAARLASTGTIAGGTGGASNGTAGVGGVGVLLQGAQPGGLHLGGTTRGGDGGQSFGDSGAAGGAGLDAAKGGRITLLGDVSGGAGSAGFSHGGAGGVAVALDAAASLVNQGHIAGGAAGGADLEVSDTGGDGIWAANAALIQNGGGITGGESGASARSNGSQGGAGVDLRGSGAVFNTAGITGGAGGASNFTAAGNGGTGLAIQGAGVIGNSGTVQGGGSGVGGDNALTPMAGSQGNGGTGAELFQRGTVTNSGRILGGNAEASTETPGGGGTGLRLDAGGLVSNTGRVAGGAGGGSDFQTGGTGGIGVFFGASGTLLNRGTIAGGTGGTSARGGGAGGAAISLGAGGTVINGAGGIISGSGPDGIIASGGASVIRNAGTISGSVNAIRFSGNATDRVVLDPGAVLKGKVVGGGGSNTLELTAAGGATGTLNGFGTQFVHFGSVVLDAGARWRLGGPSSGGQTVTLAGGSHRLSLDDTAHFADPIRGFSATDRLDLLDLSYAAGATARYADGILTVQSGGQTDRLTLPGLSASQSFTASADGSGHLEVAEARIVTAMASVPGNDPAGTAGGKPCYARGTLILTEGGEVAVERLRIGDRLVTLSGEARPLRWIGRRAYSARLACGDPDILPVVIRRGALGQQIPRRDLFVSPLHALYVDQVLVPAVLLVNGRSILQPQAEEDIEYFHLELASHDIILAEGAPAESFIDDGSRAMFQNAADYRLLYPDAVCGPARFCAPRLEEGEAVERIRQELLARADADAPAPLPLPLKGCLDEVGADRIRGWAYDDAGAPVTLSFLDGDVVIGRILAGEFRADLRDAGMGDGRHGFEFIVPGGLSTDLPHLIRVRREPDGAELPGSPRLAPVAAEPPRVDLTPCRGHVDHAGRDRVAGWAQDPADPDRPVAVQILDNGALLGRVLANRRRPDLLEAGLSSARHGFEFVPPGGLSPATRHVLEMRSESDGTELIGSPVVIEAAGAFDGTLERAVTRAVAAASSAMEETHVLSFLLARVDQLRQQAARREAGLAERSQARHLLRTAGPTYGPGSGPPPRALVLDERVPDGERDAGSAALLSHMRALDDLGYTVSFAAAEADTGGEAAAALAAGGIAVYGPPFYDSVEDVLRRQQDGFDVIYLHRVAVASRYLALARRYMPRARILYSVADLHHLRLERQARSQERPELLALSRRIRVEELKAAWSADAVLTHSGEEEAELRRLVPGARIVRVPWDVPTAQTTVPFDARDGIAFIGNYSHAPNEDAARWLADEIVPLVRQHDPGLTCLLVGAAMPPWLQALRAPGVRVLGRVRELRDQVLDRVRLTVAPLRFGAGVKGKVLDSLAAGVPCVMSRIAAEGLELPPVLQALVADTAGELAALICRLHEDKAFHDAVAAAGMAFVERHHGRDVVRDALASAIEPHAMLARTGG